MNKTAIFALTYAIIGSSVTLANAKPPHAFFVSITNFGSGPVAKFRWKYALFGGDGKIETHFNIDLKNLRVRIVNLKKSKNGSPHNLSEEFKGIKTILDNI